MTVSVVVAVFVLPSIFSLLSFYLSTVTANACPEGRILGISSTITRIATTERTSGEEPIQSDGEPSDAGIPASTDCRNGADGVGPGILRRGMLWIDTKTQVKLGGNS